MQHIHFLVIEFVLQTYSIYYALESGCEKKIMPVVQEGSERWNIEIQVNRERQNIGST